MDEHKKKFCPAVWFSGFFGLGALVHLARVVTRVSLVVGGREISLGTSLIVVVIFGALSLGLLWIGLRRPCCKT